MYIDIYGYGVWQVHGLVYTSDTATGMWGKSLLKKSRFVALFLHAAGWHARSLPCCIDLCPVKGETSMPFRFLFMRAWQENNQREGERERERERKEIAH
jgi:hypothetical protein